MHTQCMSGSVCIVHEQPFVSHSLEALLSENEFDVVYNLEFVDEIEAADFKTEPDLCILGFFEEQGKFETACKAIRRQFPTCRLLMIDARYSTAAMQAARAQNLFAYLSFHLTPELILNGIRLVLAGNECYPMGLDGLGGDGPGTLGLRDTRSDQLFTARECDVLNLIVVGLSNKMIARRLCISESTVKGYMNAVLRKTGTVNRTQAACWAIELGYGATEERSVDEAAVGPNGSGDATSLTFTVEGEVEVDPIDSFDATTELPTVESAATAVGNNQSINSEVATYLHDGQFLFDVGPAV